MEKIRKVVREILSEIMSKTDSYSSFLAAKKYVNKPNMYLHFTNVYKLGINPKKTHADPHAIYFYPVKWILDEDKWSMFQYAVTMDYFFLCQVDTSNFLNIPKLTESQADKMMKSAGIYDIWIKYGRDFSSSIPRRFWEFLDMLNVSPSDRDEERHRELPQIRWNEFWSKTGYDGFLDNKGIVNKDEPNQIGVFNRSTIKIVESGKNDVANAVFSDFYSQLISTINMDVKKQGYESNGRYYRIYGLVDGKALDIRVFPKEYGADIYYGDENGNLYKKESESLFEPERAMSSILSAIRASVEQASSSEINLNREAILRNTASDIFKDNKEHEFKSFRSVGSSYRLEPLVYNKRHSDSRRYFFNGRLGFNEEGKQVLSINFSVDKDMILGDPSDIFANIVDTDPEGGQEKWYEKLKGYGINPDTFEYYNKDGVVAPEFEISFVVDNPQQALKYLDSKFEEWLSKYNWPPGNPNARLYFQRAGSKEKVTNFFYNNVNKI
jgi:hypothetical protein